MKWFSLCFLCVSLNVYAKQLSINQWLAYFQGKDVHIFYSSDYLPKELIDQLLELDEGSIGEFNLALGEFALTLVNVDDKTYVINPLAQKSKVTTGLIIKLVDSNNNNSISSFSVNYGAIQYNSTKGVVIIQDIEATQVELNISALGYYPLVKSINSVANKYRSITLGLQPSPIRIDKITVTASQINFQSPNASHKTLLREDIENTVPLGNDPVRSSQHVAGNTSTGISAKTRTRGGNENESLIVLDNNVLRNPFHFKNFYSLFSTINLSVVDSLDFYSGVFPMQYGGRLSSVLSLQTSDNINQGKHEAGVDLFNAYYTNRYRNEDYSRQYLASIRTGGHLINDSIISDLFVRPKFDDAYFKTTQRINNNWQSSQHFLISRDEISINDIEDLFDMEVADARYLDQNLWLQWNYNNYVNSSANIQVYTSRKHNIRSGNINNENSIASVSENILTRYLGLKYSQTINFLDSFSVDFGVDVFTEDTNINSSRDINHSGRLVNELGLTRQRQYAFNFKNQGDGLATFINARYQLTDKIIFDLGLRYEYKQWIDENILSPRFNLSYFYNDSTVYRFALGRHQQSQYIDELLLEDENADYFKPASADVAVFEFNKKLTDKLGLRTEVYYKKYSATQGYYENLFNGFHVLPELFYDRIRVTPDDSQAIGAEFTLNGNYNKYRWSASYIFSDVDDEFDGIDVPRSWDQHNALKFNLHTTIFNNWSLDFTANYHNGWAKTDIIEKDFNVQVGERNNNTFDDFYQLDMKLSKQYKTEQGRLNFFIQINNLLNTQNPCCVDYKIDNGILQAEQEGRLPLIPNIGIVYKWD